MSGCTTTTPRERSDPSRAEASCDERVGRGNRSVVLRLFFMELCDRIFYIPARYISINIINKKYKYLNIMGPDVSCQSQLNAESASVDGLFFFFFHVKTKKRVFCFQL